MPLRPLPSPWLRRLTAGLALAALLWFALAQGNGLWAPPALQGLSTTAYRLAYLLVLPFERLVLLFSPPEAHHVPAHHAVADALLTSLFLVAGAEVAWRTRASLGAVALGNPGRRAATGLAVLAIASVLALGGYTVLVEPQRLQVVSTTIPVAGLPTWAHGLRLVHVSDTHYGPYTSLPYLERVVATANAQAPDLVVLTGDYVHRTRRSVPAGIAVLGGLEARLGVVAVLGNHDHWEGLDAVQAAFAGTGITLLDGRVGWLGPAGALDGPSPEALCVVGLGDHWEQPTPAGPLLVGTDGHPRIVLLHNPDTVTASLPDGVRVDLLLAGHTHGGQVRLPGLGTPILPTEAGPAWAAGLVETAHGPLVVSRGAGMAYLPVRFRVRPEVGVITLVPAP